MKEYWIIDAQQTTDGRDASVAWSLDRADDNAANPLPHPVIAGAGILVRSRLRSGRVGLSDDPRIHDIGAGSRREIGPGNRAIPADRSTDYAWS